VEHTWVMRR